MSRVTQKLGDYIEIKHGYAFKGQNFSDQGKYILLTPGNCYESGGLKLKGDKEKYYIGRIPEEFLLSKNDLLIVMTDLVQSAPILGGSLLISEDDKFLHNQRLGLVKIKKPDLLDKKFLYYLFNTKGFREQVRGSATGSTVRHTAPERIYKCNVSIPDIKIQIIIANCLSSYDDLIENNRCRIQLLEESARLLYKEWFVHFRFPGHEHVKIVDGIPEYWKTTVLKELTNLIKDGVNPKLIDPEMPYIGLEHIPRRSITLNSWGLAQDIESTKYKFLENDILFGKIRPYFHKVGFALTNGITSSDTLVFRAKDLKHWAFVLMSVSSDYFVAVASKTVREGSKMPRADWNVLKNFKLAIPPDKLLDSFSDVVQLVTQQTKILSFQNSKLSKARDILLPKLMNGDIAV